MSLLSAQLVDRDFRSSATTFRSLPRNVSLASLSSNANQSPPNHSSSMTKLSRFVLAKRRNSESNAIEIPSTNAFDFDQVQSPAASFLSFRSLRSLNNQFGSAASLDRFVSKAYEEGDQLDEYTLKSEIGSGAFSRVFEAASADSTVAIKIIRKPNLSPPPSPLLNSLSQSMESLHIQRHMSIPSLTLLQRHMEGSLPKGPTIDANQLNSNASSPAVSAYFHQQSQKLRSAQKLMDKETRIWASLSHPHILQIYDVMEVDDALCIVSELAKGGSLLDYLSVHGRIYDESVARQLFRQLVEAVEYMHSTAGIVHRDLKLENIMILDDWKSFGGGVLSGFIPTLKICDFGLSDFIHGDLQEADEEEDDDFNDNDNENNINKNTPCSPCSSNASFGVGSLHYCSPEDLRGTVTAQNGTTSDVWALGCILYAIVTGGLPFNDCFLPRLQQSILNGTFDVERVERLMANSSTSNATTKSVSSGYGSFASFSTTSAAASTTTISESSCTLLLKGMFEVDVSKRLSIREILDSDWIKGV
ncbi:UNVERIFIED_CONTAM: hypothetical protein HDU68_009255 [Siphonaria sp. JEL0065]|nr:hypothetical protein HDU68_009255 [Siphonaria sp. JEL0065]